MATRKIQDERVQDLNDGDVKDGDYVLYWMQSSQRAEQNHALEYAVQRANEMGQRLLVVFGLTDDYPEANLRHYAFMLEGLKDAQETLTGRGIKMVVRQGSPDEVAIDAGKNASLIVTDRGYMRPQKRWREKVAREAGCLVTQVESDVVVPVELASGKQEHAARTLRPRIGEYLEDFLVALTPTKVEKQSTNMRAKGLDLSDIDGVLDGRDLRGQKVVSSFPQEQLRRLRRAPQPAADRRRLAHEQVPALRAHIPDLARPRSQEIKGQKR